MKMNTNIAQRGHLMTNMARLIRGIAIGGTASLVAAILVPNIHAEMLPGAIGNDGANGFDGSITVTANNEHDARQPGRAIDGSGLSANGLHDSTTYAGRWLSAPESASWIIVDLGQSYNLSRVVFYNLNNGTADVTGTDRGIEQTSIWTHDGPTEPNANNNHLVNSPFDSTGWTLFQADRIFVEAPATPTFSATETIVMGGVDARFFALQIKDNHSPTGVDGFAGISEMQFFATPETPFAITNITVDAAALFEFASDNGQDYRLEFVTNPTNTDWQGAGFTIEGDGGTRHAFDPAGTDTQKTYRIIPF